jgi:HK97 family phage portal protein
MMKLNRSMIAGIFNVPAHMINDLEKATFSNISEQAIQFVRYTMMPWVTNWEQELNRRFSPAPNGLPGITCALTWPVCCAVPQKSARSSITTPSPMAG